MTDHDECVRCGGCDGAAGGCPAPKGHCPCDCREKPWAPATNDHDEALS